MVNIDPKENKNVQKNDWSAQQEAGVPYGAEQIQVLKGLEAVRKRPAMYIGTTSVRGLHHLVWEIVDNAVDEHLAGYGSEIHVQIHADQSITVADQGRGIPCGIHPVEKVPAIELALGTLHGGGKFGGGGYKMSGGLHGVGSSCVNALSTHMIATVKQNGLVHRIEYKKGIKTKDLWIVRHMEPGETSGTSIWFQPDPEIFTETVEFDYETIFKHLRESAFLNPGLRFFVSDERQEETKEPKELCFYGGIADFVSYINQSKKVLHNDVVYIQEVKPEIRVEVAFQYHDDYGKNGVFSYTNNVHTPDGGTHETGFKSALTKAVQQYMLSRKIVKEEEMPDGEDVRVGLTAIVSVKIEEPQFEGQTKTKLGSDWVRPVVDKLVFERVSQYLEENSETAALIAKKIIDSYEEKMAARRAREDRRKKKQNEEQPFSLSTKLKDCTSKVFEEREIFFVEGESAGGSAAQGRNSYFQAILALRGKILNSEKSNVEKLNENKEIDSIKTSIGTDIGDDFSYQKLRYNKIIMMTDADVDGSHIAILLLTFFYRYMRELIEKGHVYMAQPPLYGIKGSGDKVLEYAYNERQLAEAKKRHPRSTVQRYKGLGEMNAKELWATTMDPERRLLIKVTLEDAAEAETLFSMLMGDDSHLRKEYISQNSHKAILDI